MPPLSMEVDHIVPLHQGGSNQWSNFVALCASCHAAKTNMEIIRDNENMGVFTNDLHVQYTNSVQRSRAVHVRVSPYFPAPDPCPEGWRAWRTRLMTAHAR
jgi:HNH endonuclease